MFASEPGRRARSRLSSKSQVPAKLLDAPRDAPKPAAPRRKAKLAIVAPKAEMPAERGGLPPKIARYLATADIPSPCLVVDVDIVAHNYLELAGSLPAARIFYAVKANPADEIVSRLARLGSAFDTASMGEIDLCLRHGVTPDRISFGNTIKKERDIASAYEKGVRMFAFDSDAELEKIARVAPGAKVYCRVLMECEGAEWPLSRKFGCEPEMAADLLVRARDMGLDAYGVSFHVGSQQTDLTQYDKALGADRRALRGSRQTRHPSAHGQHGRRFPVALPYRCALDRRLRRSDPQRAWRTFRREPA